jgi:hypothetical protein
MRGINYRLWSGDVGKCISESMRVDYPHRDTFFVSSAAYDAGISEKTLRNYLRTDPTLNFVDRLPGGAIATCSESMQAWGQSRRERDGRKNVKTWQTNFTREVQVTEVGASSAVGMRNINERK